MPNDNFLLNNSGHVNSDILLTLMRIMDAVRDPIPPGARSTVFSPAVGLGFLRVGSYPPICPVFPVPGSSGPY